MLALHSWNKSTHAQLKQILRTWTRQGLVDLAIGSGPHIAESIEVIPTKDGTGRVATHEILVNTPAVGSLIREGKTYMLPGVMQVGRNVGMSRMDDSLVDKAREGVISKAEAIRRAEDQREVTALLADVAD